MEFKVVLMAIIKDELDLVEWVAYHLLLGFEHIYIYDDQSQNPIKEQLKSFKNGVTVIEYNYEGSLKYCQKQIAAYNQFLEKYGKSAEYVAFLDGDEFLVLKKHSRIQDFLKDFPWDGIGINSIFFNSNQHVRRPDGLLIENYTQAISSKIIKSIVKPNCLRRFYIHRGLFHDKSFYFGMNGKPIKSYNHEVTEETYKYAQINHYYTKSLEDWKNKLERKQIHQLSLNMNRFHFEHDFLETTIIRQGWPDKIKAFRL
jgi:hypothetical protein